MRRVDRIFGALSDTTPKNKCKDKNGNSDNTKLLEDKECNDENDIIESSNKDGNGSTFLSRLLTAKKYRSNIVPKEVPIEIDSTGNQSQNLNNTLTCKQVSNQTTGTTTSTTSTTNKYPRQHVVEMESNIDMNDNMLDSPLAPLYSPLTPLLIKNMQRNATQSSQENSSPLRSMSPDTLSLLETFNAFNDNLEKSYEEDDSITQNEKIKNSSNNKTNGSINTQVVVTDFSSDTDSDYVPDSEDNSNSENISASSQQAMENNDNIESNLEKNAEFTYEDPNAKTLNDHEFENEIVSINMSPNTDNFNKKRQVLSDDEEAPDENVDIINEQPEIIDTPAPTAGRPKRGRKRKYGEHTLAETKHRKYNNLPYNSKNKFVASKKFIDYDCKCIKVCPQQVSKELRLKEFNTFVTLGSYEAQLLYIVSCVTETTKTRAYTMLKGNKTGKNKPKAFTRKYTICDIQVCRDMFIKTFQVTPKKIDLALKKKRNGGPLKDHRGQSRGGWNKTSDQDVAFIKNIIDSIPKYESHYRREQINGVKYLKPGTTLQVIYDLYLLELKRVFGEDKKPVSLSTLKRIFYANYNLRLKGLKKDTCNRCDKLTNQIKNTAVTEEQDKLIEEKEKHLKRSEDLRHRMNEELKKAKTDKTFECLTFDLEKTLPLPRIPTNIVFYKRQLWLYNCGIHAGSNDCGHCYTWVEGEAGRGAQEVGSCLIHFIKNKLDSKVEHLSLWSDCCGGQKRNIKIVLMLKVTLNTHPTLKTITLNYLESGHTFLPNDTDFSKIETQLKHHERIYTADEYIKVMEMCKKKNPLEVYKMKKQDFLSSKNIEKKIVNRKTFVGKEKTNWLITKGILLKKENEATVFMKTILDDEFQELNIQKKFKGKPLTISESDFSLLWPDGKEIPQAKLDDLRSMYDLIPKDCLPFYYSLRGNPSFVEDVEGYAGPIDFETEDPDLNYTITEDIDTD